jgi:homoserine O-acetyltransferase
MLTRIAPALAALALIAASPVLAQPRAPEGPASWTAGVPVQEGDYLIKNYRFRDGESLPEMKAHYATAGVAKRDAGGRITNAVLVLHGTTGSGQAYLSNRWNDLFGAGAPLDASKYFLIFTDAIGHGQSSKPSDGLKAKFPKYDYDDMVDVQHRVLTDKLGVNSLELIIGMSMGCMHAFVWGETWPDFSKRLMPLACAPTEIAGRNRANRRMMIDAVTKDPAYMGGDYTTPPVNGLRDANYIITLAAGSPLTMQRSYPTRATTDSGIDRMATGNRDANDFIYQMDSSRNYNPAPNLEKITAKVLWVNSADDFLNPPELNFDKSLGPRIRRLKFVLIPISDKTAGHGTHSIPALWNDDLRQLMAP